MTTTTQPRQYAIGDRVICPEADCGGCWPNRPNSYAGQIVEYTHERPDFDTPGPYLRRSP